jgi:hypothetical protein
MPASQVAQFVSKPFTPQVLMARVRAALRRPGLPLLEECYCSWHCWLLHVFLLSGYGHWLSPQRCLLVQLPHFRRWFHPLQPPIPG